MDRTLEDYLSLPYTIELTRDATAGWFVRVKELRGCMSQGDTAQEALDMIQDALRGWLEVALEQKIPIPEPQPEEEYSGKFVVRVPRSLHHQLVERAEHEDVSLNQYINVALAQATGTERTIAPQPTAAESTSWPGLKAGVRQALLAAGLADDAGELDEKLFASWAEQQLREIEGALQDGYVRDALRDLDRLSQMLTAASQKSPALGVLAGMTKLLRQLAERTTANIRVTEYVREATATLIAGVPADRVATPLLDAVSARVAEPSMPYGGEGEEAKW